MTKNGVNWKEQRDTGSIKDFFYSPRTCLCGAVVRMGWTSQKDTRITLERLKFSLIHHPAFHRAKTMQRTRSSDSSLLSSFEALSERPRPSSNGTWLAMIQGLSRRSISTLPSSPVGEQTEWVSVHQCPHQSCTEMFIAACNPARSWGTRVFCTGQWDVVVRVLNYRPNPHSATKFIGEILSGFDLASLWTERSVGSIQLVVEQTLAQFPSLQQPLFHIVLVCAGHTIPSTALLMFKEDLLLPFSLMQKLVASSPIYLAKPTLLGSR